MSAGLDAIAMAAALQERQGMTKNMDQTNGVGGNTEAKETAAEKGQDVSSEDVRRGNDDLPKSDSSLPPMQRIISQGFDEETKASLLMQLANQAQQTQERRGPSSPAVVSSTSQEEEEEKPNSAVMEEMPHSTRVVSIEALNVSSHSTVSSTASLPEGSSPVSAEQDVADQLMAVLQSKPTVINDPGQSTLGDAKVSRPVAAKKASTKKPSVKKSIRLPTTKKSTAKAEQASSPSPSPSTTVIASNPSEEFENGVSKKTSKGTQSFFANILADPEKFLFTMEPLFNKTLSMVIDTTSVIKDGVQPNDVMCGRGGESNHHAGNIQYRKLVKAYRGLYVQSTRRVKPKIAQAIVYAVRQVGGRFLKRVDSDSAGGNGGSLVEVSWTDVGNVKAREKTSQALREGAPDLRSNVPATSTISSSSHHESAPSSPNGAAAGAVSSALVRLESSGSTFSQEAAIKAGYGNGAPSHMAPSAVTAGNNFPASAMAHDKSSLSGNQSLTSHPLFHTLPPYQQRQIVMEELQAAREAAAAAEYAALRHYHYQRELEQQFGNNSGKIPPGNATPSGGELGVRAYNQSLQGRIPTRFDHPNQQQTALNGSSYHGASQLHENQLKRHMDVISPPLAQASGDTGNEDESKALSTCRGPRLKRLKLRRQLEA